MTTTTALDFIPIAFGVTYIERDGRTIGCIVHGRGGHTLYAGADEVASDFDAAKVRRIARRLFSR